MTNYKLDLVITISLKEEELQKAEELMKGAVNEMLGRLEYRQDARIGLVHKCDVKEIK